MYAGAGPMTAVSLSRSRRAAGGRRPWPAPSPRRPPGPRARTVSFTSRPNGGDPNRRRKLELGVVERGRVVVGDGPDRRVLGLVGLDDRGPPPLASPGPADRLGEQLVGPLRRALVGQVQGDVGRDDADERHVRDVEALRDEARPDEDVELARRERVEDPLRRAAPLDDVAIQAADPQPREALPDLVLDSLRAAAEVRIRG